MPSLPHCPECKASIESPAERTMPDGVVEHRCPSCSYQIPLYTPFPDGGEACPECGSPVDSSAILEEVDSSGLLSFLYCAACRCLFRKYWGTLL